MKLTQSNALHAAAQRKLPLGVTSNFRYWGPEHTVYVDRGKGAHLWDIDGNRYIDYRLGYGPAILGHSDDRVDDRVAEAIRKGHSFSLGNPLELEVADKITSVCPGIDMVRFTNSGTESTMHALRLARAYTRREKFIMFEGQYHGLHDTSCGRRAARRWGSSRRSPSAIPFSSGIPEAIRSLVILLALQRPGDAGAHREAELARRGGDPGGAGAGQLRRHSAARRLAANHPAACATNTASCF